MRAIEQCRTEVLGGQIHNCPKCGYVEYPYHACRNRHCPKCQPAQGQVWLEQYQALLLPVPYFLLPLPYAGLPVATSASSVICSFALRRWPPNSWHVIRFGFSVIRVHTFSCRKPSRFHQPLYG